MNRCLPLTLLLLALGNVACSTDSGGARAQRIEHASQLIGGPKALGQLGDYLVENEHVRFIVHGPGPNRGATIYGGSLIDADLQRPHSGDQRGNDQLGEIAPVFFLEAMDPVFIGVTADGTDGGAAVISVEGVGGDLLQMVSALNLAVLYPPDLRFRVDYILAPGAQHLEIKTTITNESSAPHPLPFLGPEDLAGAGLDIPGLDQIKLSVPLGHIALFGAENQIFGTGKTGFNARYSIEDQYANAGGLPAFPGLVTDVLATRGRGVSYALAVPESPDNYAARYADLYPGQLVTGHSLLLPFLYSAVTGVFHAHPPAELAPRQSFSYSAWLVVGSGDVASTQDVIHRLRGTPTGSFSGQVVDAQTLQPLPGASLIVQTPGGDYVSQLDVDKRGYFQAALAAGDYTYRMVHPALRTSAPQAFSIQAGTNHTERIALPPPAHLSLQVRDAAGRALPSKATLVARFDSSQQGADPREFLYDLAAGEAMRPTTFDPQRNEYIEAVWFMAKGQLNASVRPGQYDLYVSRGIEYGLERIPVSLKPGEARQASAVLRQEVNTQGYVAADMHLHAAPSLDSRMVLTDRVTSVAAEGIELAVATDHNFVTDYQPTIAALQLEDWIASAVGLELTTFEMGHFNGYPLRVDSSQVRGGEFSWAGRPPDELFQQIRDLGRYGPDETIVQVNHPRDQILGYFSQFNVDSETAAPAPRTGLRAVFAPLSPEFAPAEFSLDFDALELVNGKRLDTLHHYRVPDPLPPGDYPSPAPIPGEILRDEDGRIAHPGVVEDWFTLLNGGLRTTAVGNSDSHKGLTQEPGYPRTMLWVGDEQDRPGGYDDRTLVTALKSRRAFITNGPIVELTVQGAPVGQDVQAPSGAAEVRLHVTSAQWIPFDRVTLWVNGSAALEVDVPTGQRHDFTLTHTLQLSADSWVVAEIRGDTSLFPVVPPLEFESLNAQTVLDALGGVLDLSGLTPNGLQPARTYRVTPLAITNPVWVDADGDGTFTPPAPALATHPAARQGQKAPDVRALYESLGGRP